MGRFSCFASGNFLSLLPVVCHFPFVRFIFLYLLLAFVCLSSFLELRQIVTHCRARIFFIPLSHLVYLHSCLASSLALYQLLRSPRGLGYQLTPVNKGVAGGKCLSANGIAASKHHDNVRTNRVRRYLARVTGQSAGASVGPHEVMTRDQHIIHH